MSATDEIYRELCEGVKNGLDWPQFLARHGNSKGPLYNAIARFFTEAGARMTAVTEELSQRQDELDQVRTTAESLDKEKEEARGDVAALEKRQSILNEQNEALEAKVSEKRDLLMQVAELEKLGFGVEVLKQLKETLTEIGVKRGLKAKETVGKFFADLKDYDAKTGFEQEIHRLETISHTRKLEAEKWQAEADNASRRHQDLSEAIAAVQSLTKQGVKTDHIVSWDRIVGKVGGPEGLQNALERYASMSQILETKTRGIADGEKKLKGLAAEIRALDEKKAEIVGAINSLSAGGVKQIDEVSRKAVAGLDVLSASGVKQISRVGEQALTALKSLMHEMNRFAEINNGAGKLEKELQYARYITTFDPAVLKAFPKEVVDSFLIRAHSYCQLNQLNPMVRVPDSLAVKYANYGVYQSTQVGLLDLIKWAQIGLVGAGQ